MADLSLIGDEILSIETTDSLINFSETRADREVNESQLLAEDTEDTFEIKRNNHSAQRRAFIAHVFKSIADKNRSNEFIRRCRNNGLKRVNFRDNHNRIRQI